MAWVGTSGNVYRSELLRRIMPIPAEDYGLWGADWYLVHLTTLLGPVVAIDEIGGLYRLHGRNAFEPAAPVLDLDRIRREIRYQQTTARSLIASCRRVGSRATAGDPVVVQSGPSGHFPQARSRRPPGGRGPGRRPGLEGGPGRRRDAMTFRSLCARPWSSGWRRSPPVRARWPSPWPSCSYSPSDVRT